MCPFASWNLNATTFADFPTVGYGPYNLYIDINNTIYVANGYDDIIQTWNNADANLSTTVYNTNNGYSNSLFVTSEGDIYFDNGYSTGQVRKWLTNATNSITVMDLTVSCTGLFIDLNNTLYCSIADLHQVVTKLLDDSSNTPRIVAGTGCYGSASNMLAYPEGIFVDIDFNLYVADYDNSRIQLFQKGQPNATTVAGSTAPGTIALSNPTGVVLDADGYLFIVDQRNSRIVGSGQTGFRCVAGCSGTAGEASDQLNKPRTMAFDSYGNIFVIDTFNDRIQKFVPTDDSCGM